MSYKTIFENFKQQIAETKSNYGTLELLSLLDRIEMQDFNENINYGKALIEMKKVILEKKDHHFGKGILLLEIEKIVNSTLK